MAPAIQLYSYRVFGRNSEGATNFDILKALDAARTDRCDLINLSLTYGAFDEALRAGIEDARAAGMLVIAASGNDGRQPVSFPASDEMAVAVAALGRDGTFPLDSIAMADRKAPFGQDRKNFVAAFSNIGVETDLIGPGVEVLSTVPGGYAPMSGTSMACPAVTGIAARVLSKNKALLKQKRDAARSEAIAKLLLQSARPMGFGARFEGRGLPG